MLKLRDFCKRGSENPRLKRFDSKKRSRLNWRYGAGVTANVPKTSFSPPFHPFRSPNYKRIWRRMHADCEGEKEVI
ncbi:hypothetical protein GCM10023213_23770 [Prosthecobacter algae]|uniref:Uncharacterized protein n=1 Tax=Prosthecobacter algae TaxID=1144682 RepID=A0ABP9P4M3_9BACT